MDRDYCLGQGIAAKAAGINLMNGVHIFMRTGHGYSVDTQITIAGGRQRMMQFFLWVSRRRRFPRFERFRGWIVYIADEPTRIWRELRLEVTQVATGVRFACGINNIRS